MSAVIRDRDVWAAALLIVKRYGDDAVLEVSQRADQMLDEGDMPGAATWHRMLDAIERLQAKAPAEGEAVHSNWNGPLFPARRPLNQKQSIAAPSTR